jgi:hypothetical protein
MTQLKQIGLASIWIVPRKNRLQAVVEKMHKHWMMDKDYMPPPKMGTLGYLDMALIVAPQRSGDRICTDR